MDEKYFQELYKLILKEDPTFGSDMPYQKFVLRMKDQQYKKGIEDWMRSVNNSFSPETLTSQFNAPQQGAQPVVEPKKKGTMDSSLDESLSGSSLPNQQRPAAESTGIRQPQVPTLEQLQKKKAPEKKEEDDGQGWFLNTVSAIDRGFYKNLIGSPIKGLGTLIEKGTEAMTFGKVKKGPISDALIKFGDYFNKTIDELTPQDEEFKNSLTDQFSQAFGQVASLALTGGMSKAAAVGGAGKLGAGATTARAAIASQAAPEAVTVGSAVKGIVSDLANPVSISAGLSMGQSEFDRAKEMGATDDQAFEAFWKTAAVGSVLEKIPVMQFLKRFNQSSGGGLANYIKTKGVAGITGGLEEMTTEVLQQIYSNKTAKDIYNANQDIFEGVGESGGVGFGVGFLLNAMGANAKLLRKEGRDEEADIIERQLKELETQAQRGGRSSYSFNGIPIKPIETDAGIQDPRDVISNMIDNMSAADLAKSNIEIKNDPELKLKLQNKIVTSSIKEQAREANPNLTEEQLDEITNLELELRKLSGNTTQLGKDKVAEIRSRIKQVQENAVQKPTTDEGVLRTGQAGMGLPQMGEGNQPATTEGQEAVAAEKSQEQKIEETAKDLQILQSLSLRIDDPNNPLSESEKEIMNSYYDTLKQVPNKDRVGAKDLSEEYHKAKADGVENELTKAVENLLSTPIVQTQKTSEALSPIFEGGLTDEQYNLFNKAEGLLPSDIKEKQVAPSSKVSEAYARAKADGSNPELVKAVEDLLATGVPIAEGVSSKTQTQQVPEQVTVSSIEALPADVKVNTEFSQEDGTVSPVMGNEKMLSDMYNQAISVPAEQRTEAQAKVVSVVESLKGKMPKPEAPPKLSRDLSILITPATVRSFSRRTKRISKLSKKYDELVKVYNETKDDKVNKKIKELELQILEQVKNEIVAEVSKVQGVSVSFGANKRGLFDGKFEPSLNMTLSITPQADTNAASNLLFDFAEKYSQDSFIVEAPSQLNDDFVDGKIPAPLGDVDSDGLTNYPQLIYTFVNPITDEQLASISVGLKNSGVEAFSINNDGLQVSVIPFLSEEQQNLSQDEQRAAKKQYFKDQADATSASVRNVLGDDGLSQHNIKIQKSTYVGAINERSEDAKRKYDRRNVLQAFQSGVSEVEALTTEYNALRQKEIELSKKKQKLSPEDQKRFDELTAKIQPTVEKTFATNREMYKQAKLDAEKIAKSAIKGMSAFVSRFGIKRASRASVKTMRWYNSFTERLGDGARVNIIVKNSEDADAVFEAISKQYPQGTDADLRRITETTELGYPKRLIEIRMPNGIIAEFQIMTPEAYLAKDGVSEFEEGRREFAKKELEKVRNKLGWNIPDGLGHYFYEINRDFNVDDSLREEAERLSNLYYDAFTNPDSRLGEDFMADVIAFKEKVDAADKSTWDKGNEGKAPKTLVEYAETFTPKPDSAISRSQMKSFNEGIDFVQKNAEEYRNKIKDKKKVPNPPIFKLFKDVSTLIARAYDRIVSDPNSPMVKNAYAAMIKETLDQFDFIVSKGLKVVKHEGVGEPYANSAEMLRDLSENKTLKFLPNDVAYGQGTTQASENIGLQPSGRKLEDGYELTNSEVFRIVHDYFGHGILGNQFGPIGEENATLQHLDLYSNTAAPAVIFQTRGQNSWVNFSGENARAIQLRQEAKQLNKQGKTEEANKLLAEADKIFKFAEPKIAIFPNIFNFKRYETARRISESSRIDNRADKRNQDLPGLLEKYSNRSRTTRGINKRILRRVQRLGGFDVIPVAEYTFDDSVSDKIKKAFPLFKGTQKVYEITDGNVFRELMIRNLEGFKYKTSVTIHSARDFEKMRMFVTEDGKTGITLSKDGYLGGGFSKQEAGNENSLSQLIILGIKEGATTADAFDTVLPDYYSNFGFKAVARLEFNEEFKPEGWDYKVYRAFNNGRPDVVFFIYDGGDRNTIEDRLGLFDQYKDYDKENAKFFDKDSYSDAEELMKQSAVKRLEFELGVEEEVSNLPGFDRLRSEIDGIITRSRRRGAKLDRIAENVMNYVMNSKLYEDATDVQREQLIRDIEKEFGIKQKAAPSFNRLFGNIGNIAKITMSEKVALVKQIKDMARGAKDAVRAWREANQLLTKEIKKLASSGKISSKQAANVIRKFSKVNVLSPRSVSKFVTYMSNVFRDAEYANKLKIAESVRGDISKLSKIKDKNADLRDLGERFTEINPSMVDDIDAYNKIAAQVKESLVGSVRRKEKLQLASMVNIDSVSNYINQELKSQEEKLRKELADELQELMGVDMSQFSYEDMISLLDKKEPVTKYDESIIRDTVNKAFEIYSSIIKKAIETKRDPFTDAPFELTKSQEDVIKRFMDMDLGRLDVKEAIKAIDALNNFIQNKSTARMETVVAEYTGRLNASKVRAKKIQAIRLRKNFSPWMGKVLAEYTTNLGPLFERYFKGVMRGGYVEDMMGVTKVKNGKALAERMANMLAKDYITLFYSKKPNGKKFNTAFNNIERGMVAFLSRNVIGTEAQIKAEFKRRKDLVRESIEALETGNTKERQKAKIYSEVYEKLSVEEAEDSGIIRSNADPLNVEAVDWWTEEWNKIYPDLADLSLNVYNKSLKKGTYYNPDRLSKTSFAGSGRDLVSENESMFNANTGAIFIPRETGSIMDSDFPDQLPQGDHGASRYVDLSFDSNNANSMYDALIDLKTAAAIRQVNAFYKSKDMKYIVPESEDRDLLKRRLDLYFQKIRNKAPFADDELAKGVKRLNKIAGVGVGQALGGVTMPLKQVVPVMFNTLVNAGSLDMGALFSPSKNNFIRNSGFAIANRGISSQAQIDSINRLLEEASSSNTAKTLDLIAKANELWLKAFLVAPDAWVARASWLSYYEQSLKKQGIDTSTIDWDTHQVNEEAGNYAQRMLDRQQNISDPDQAGKLFAQTDSPSMTLATKILMPFASFRLSQATRLANDLSTIGHWTTSTTEDKVIAARSLAGYAVEMATFRALQAGIIIALGAFSKELMGGDDDEEDMDKKINNALKGQATSTVVDLFSPLPVFDKAIQHGAFYLADFVQNVMELEEDEKMNIFEPKGQEYVKNLGLFGITAERGMQLFELSNLTFNDGSFKDNYGNEKYLNEPDKEALKPLVGVGFLSSVGLLPSEANSVVRTALKDAKRRSSTKEGGETEYDLSVEGMQEAETERNKVESQQSKMEKIEVLEKMLERGGHPDKVEEIERKLMQLRMSKEAKRKYQERTKGERLREKRELDNLLQGYDSKEDMKRYNPNLYERTFGKRSQYYKENKWEIEVESQMNKTLKKQEDAEYRYVPKNKKSKSSWGGNKGSGSSSYERVVRDADGNIISSTKRTSTWD